MSLHKVKRLAKRVDILIQGSPRVDDLQHADCSYLLKSCYSTKRVTETVKHQVKIFFVFLLLSFFMNKKKIDHGKYYSRIRGHGYRICGSIWKESNCKACVETATLLDV